MRLSARRSITWLAILGIALVAATVPLWLGEALFCDDVGMFCGLGWLILGTLILGVSGIFCGALGEAWAGLAAGLAGVLLGTYVAVQLESAERGPGGLPSTWDFYIRWATQDFAVFAIGYAVAWVVVLVVRESRQQRRDEG